MTMVSGPQLLYVLQTTRSKMKERLKMKARQTIAIKVARGRKQSSLTPMGTTLSCNTITKRDRGIRCPVHNSRPSPQDLSRVPTS